MDAGTQRVANTKPIQPKRGEWLAFTARSSWPRHFSDAASFSSPRKDAVGAQKTSRSHAFSSFAKLLSKFPDSCTVQETLSPQAECLGVREHEAHYIANDSVRSNDPGAVRNSLFIQTSQGPLNLVLKSGRGRFLSGLTDGLVRL
jgi:hypothetical protein